MILNVLQRPGGGCRDMARIIHRSHERRAQRRIFAREATAMVGALLEAKILEVDPVSRQPRAHVDLQEDFSLNHALALWLVEALGALAPEAPTYALDVLTLVESIVENPDYILAQQLSALKTIKMGELKAAGVEYEERIAELEKLEYPKPMREFVYETFNLFAREHPWVRGDDVRPKSIARKMVERFMDFNEYVREYELGRAEGALLRYLSDVYKALVQTVPAPAKSREVEDIEVFLRAIVRAVDSSLLDEWERMFGRAPDAGQAPAAAPEGPAEPDITRDERAFTVLVRGALFQLLRALAKKDWALAASMVSSAAAESERWTPAMFEGALAPFFEEHGAIRLDPSSRTVDKSRITPGAPGAWEVLQIICDPRGDDDWALSCWIDLDASSREGKPIVVMRGVAR
jgi:hypothetical protein